ncbi:MAG: type II toxin-antitoxin system RelE/ParE family toxin [Bryobacteraceae bacterium]|nr:type II toxin-antitoxin system RelE/ParE family toxin [Solibacteraceae bacterium]MCO5353804.1 type II toxin-antitoxin system RelE/ParE family toxin [Bryobacteraceae bacterium]
MIWSFRSRETEQLFLTRSSRKFQSCAKQAFQKLRMLDAASSLTDLAVLPGNRLESLKGDRDGQWSIRVNSQYRICFVWRDNEAHDVELTDYH